MSPVNGCDEKQKQNNYQATAFYRFVHVEDPTTDENCYTERLVLGTACNDVRCPAGVA